MKVEHPPAGTIWFCVRRNGTAKRRGWIDDVSLAELPNRIGARQDDIIEVCIANNFRPVALRGFSRVFCERARGLVGMEITMPGKVLRLAPTWMLASNLSFQRALEKFLKERSASVEEFVAGGSLRTFSARQILLSVGGKAGMTELFRGAPLIAPTQSINESRIIRLADGIGQWMIRNQSADGAIPYKYWPSRGAESPADNAIRRFLGSLSLARLGELRGSTKIREAARCNLRFNLARYFRDIGEGRGAIVENTGAKLGAAAIAALAILESPARGEFYSELTMLAAGVDSLVDEELGFRTFFFPPERDGDNWNFYSGEALLFLSEAVRRGEKCAPSLDRCVAVFSRCRARHYQARNPAFVPWHTQACTSLYAQTGRKEFADFVFEINDWLLSMQQWDEISPDMRGRFYDPKRPEFGPPHAASTGAYLEGLADALALARAVGDVSRAAAYEVAISRGFRSLCQLQFRDQHDSYYISKKNRVMGALRTEVYDNAVRVDSAAHALIASMKILHPAKFSVSVTRHSYGRA